MRPVRPHLRQVEFSVWETGVSKLSHTEIQILKMSDRVVYTSIYIFNIIYMHILKYINKYIPGIL